MNTTPAFINTLNKTDVLMKKLLEESSAVRCFYENGNIRETYTHAMKLEEISEKFVLLTRTLPAYTGAPLALTDIEEIISNNIPIELGFTAEGWFSLRIPLLLPKKAAGSADYIRSSLYPAMRNFFVNKNAVRYNNCVLIYRHIYDRNRPERKKRDHDNIEINMVSDIVAMYVMPDDGPSICSHYYCSTDGLEERTEIYVVPKRDFPIWLVMEKAMPDEGVMLYENRQI